ASTTATRPTARSNRHAAALSSASRVGTRRGYLRRGWRDVGDFDAERLDDARSAISELHTVEPRRLDRGRGKRTDGVERLGIDDLSSLVRLRARHRDAQLC